MSPDAAATPATAPEEAGPRRSRASRLVGVLTSGPATAFLVVVGLFWLVPTFGLLMTSLLPAADANQEGWWQIFSEPGKLTLENYSSIFGNESITSSLWTTALVTVGGTLLPLLVGSLAGYAFAWLEFPGRDWIFLAVIAMLVVPLQMALIPIFSLYNSLGIFDSVTGLVLFHAAFGLPFAIFLLRNFFAGIPRELLEAARLDGASELRIFLRVILPLGLPAIASLAIFQFLWTWNDLLVALTFGRETQVITVAIFGELRQFGSNIDVIAPASFVSLIIPLIVFFSFQRYFV
jgi:alpha-glucoside transport system permease protein